MTDTDWLLVLPILVLTFSAYEKAGLTLLGWHTISYYAAEHRWLKYLIIVLFLAGGVSGAIWFAWHLSKFIPR